jgi:hypothetical protein
VDRVRQLYDEGKAKDAIDFRLLDKDSTFDVNEMERVLRVGLFCCMYEPQYRPLMRDVVNALENAREGTSPIFSWSMPQQGQVQESPYDLNDITSTFDSETQPFHSTADHSTFSHIDVD